MSAWLPESWILLLPPTAVCIGSMCHILIVRLSPRRSEWKHLFLGMLIGGLLLWGGMIGEIFSGKPRSEIVAAFVLNTLSYLGLAYIYAEFNNINLTSLRIRVLRECRQSRGGLTMDQLLKRYDETTLITHRLDKYVRHRFLIREDDTYRVGGNPAIAWMCRGYRLIHRILFGTRMSAATEVGEPTRR